MSIPKPIFITDIDGVLLKHTEHKPWHKDYKPIPNSPVYQQVFRMLDDWRNKVSPPIPLFIATGRPIRFRKQTEEHLRQGFALEPSDYTLCMNRPIRKSIHLKGHESKKLLYTQLTYEGYSIVNWIDDDPLVTDFLVSMGETPTLITN